MIGCDVMIFTRSEAEGGSQALNAARAIGRVDNNKEDDDYRTGSTDQKFSLFWSRNSELLLRLRCPFQKDTVRVCVRAQDDYPQLSNGK